MSEIPMHLCTDEDYAQFDEISQSSISLESIKEKGGMMCLDWEENPVLLANQEYNPSYRSLDIMFLPCGQPETKIGGKVDRIPDDCEFDRNATISYLGPLQFLVYHNQGSFELDEYGNSRIYQHSQIDQQQVDEYRPNWLKTDIQQNVLVD